MSFVAGVAGMLGAENVEGVPVAAIIVAIVLIAVNGAFVAAEFALLGSMRTRIEPLAEDGRMTGRAALRAMGRLGPMLAGTQLGITICSLALGSVIEPAVAGSLESLFGRFDWPDTLSTVLAVVIALSIVVFLHLLFGEMVPRSIALAAPERALLALSVPVGAFVAVFRPLIWFLNLLARLGARLFGVQPSDELRSAATSAELSIMLAESAEEGLLEDDEAVLLSSALSFVERRVSEIMVPSSRMVTVPSDATVADIERVVVESGHTRILLVGGANGAGARGRRGSSATVGARAVAGFVHAKDLLRMAPEQRDRPVPIRPRSLMAVPEEITLPALLVDMRARRAHLAVVIDDHGATVGMVTMEDVLECIVGDIRDESDRLVERLEEQADEQSDEGERRVGTDDLADRLEAALADRLGASRVELANLTRLSGGASRETWSFDATVDGAESQPWVLQRERPGGGRSGPGMAAEATLVRLAAAEGVPVPPLIASDEGRDDLGAPFLVTGRVEGETIPRRLLRDDAYSAARPKVAFEAGAALARIHQISAAEFGDRLSAQDQVEQFRSVLDMFGEPHPAFELGFRWLERNRPAEASSGPDALVVVHGDFRTGNLIVDGEGLRAVLDWELAHLGHRAEDLGWFCVRAWRFGSPHRAGGFGPVEDLLAGYRSVDGVDIDLATLQWYEALGTLKWGVMCMVQSHSHLSGVSRSVELATIGRRTCENEFDLLELIR